MNRKPADRAPVPERGQQLEKTPAKKKSDAEIELTLPQNSNFPPLSQSETPDNIATENVATKSVSVEPQPMAKAPQTSSPGPAGASLSQRDQSEMTAATSTSKHIGLRITAGILALTPLTLLVIAGILKPAAQGLGTHQQLGLPPCSLRLLAGIRCPACGMTTSWSYFSRGNWLASISTNAGGFLLALLCIALILTAAQVVRCGRLPSPRVQGWLTIAGAGVLAVTLVDWIIRLWV